MAFIGNQPFTAAFLTDTFSGNGSTVAFTMTVAPANTSSIIVAITGVLQDPSTYSVSGTTLTFSAAPPSGTSNISVRYLGIPASGVTTTAYRTVTNFTATAGQTSFSVPSYTVGYIDVYRNGVRLVSTDYTATTGTTVVLNNACTVGDSVVTESFLVSSVLNALPTTGGTIGGNLVITGTETVPTITSPAATALTLQTNNGTTAMTIDTSQRVTTPSQPSFFATLSSSISGSQTVVFDNVVQNVGSCYSGSTGRFTAPIAGRYLFSYCLLTNATSTYHEALFYVNGAVKARTQVYAGAASNSVSSTGTIVYNLAAGDYCNMYSTDAVYGSTSPNLYTWFTGTLLG